MADEKDTNVNENENEETEPKTPTIEELQAQIANLQKANQKLKDANTKASADASDYKKKWQATQSDAEREAEERAEELRLLREQNAALLRDGAIQTYKASYTAMGYSEELALKKAEFMADGKIADAIAVEKDFLVAHDKELGASATKAMGKPPLGSGSTPMTKSEIMAIKDTAERQKAIAEHIELFE